MTVTNPLVLSIIFRTPELNLDHRRLDAEALTMAEQGPGETMTLISKDFQLLMQSPAKIEGAEDCLNEGDEGKQTEGSGQNPGMQRYLVAIEYIGTRFCGMQQQKHSCRTVAGVLEEAFQRYAGQPVSVACSSRTDSGVHALSNVCHVDIERMSKRKPGEVLPPLEPAVVRRAVNHFLQKNECDDVSVIDVRRVSSNFHARFNAKERTYFYRLLTGPENLSTFEKDRAWHVPRDLDLSAMQKACRVLVGHHDFSSFRAIGCQANSPIRTLDELNVTEVVSSLYFPTASEREQREMTNYDHGKAEICKEQSNLTFGARRMRRWYVVTARGRSFLYHQVRLLVGVLKQVGTGHLTILDVERILNAKDVTQASPMAPACGLYLGSVQYDLGEDTT